MQISPTFLQRSLLSTLLAVSLLAATGMSQDAELPRRISLGTKLQPVTAETQERQSLKNGRGVEVVEVLPGSNAEAMKLRAGDVLVNIGGKPIEDVQKFVALIGALRADKPLEIKFYRDGSLTTMEYQPKELAKESSAELDIQYGHVNTKVGRLRTVLTLPKQTEKAPAIMLLSGLGNAFVEHPQADPTGMRSLAYALTAKGFVVLRVEKPGCGDSEGGPAQDVDFQSVVDGYVAALKELKTNSRVAADSVWLFGASMGGVQAGVVAAAESVKGVAVFGTMLPNWQEFIVSSTRRQLLASPAAAADVEAEVASQAAGWSHIIVEGLAPDDIAVKYPNLTDWVDSTWSEGKYFSGIHYKFFQQAGKAEIAKSFENFTGPVLSIWGENDIVTSNEGHRWLTDIVNRKSPGYGTFLNLPNIDHNMRDSTIKDPQDGPAMIIVDKVDAWIRSKSNS